MILYPHNIYGASEFSGAKPFSKYNIKNDTIIFSTVKLYLNSITKIYDCQTNGVKPGSRMVAL